MRIPSFEHSLLSMSRDSKFSATIHNVKILLGVLHNPWNVLCILIFIHNSLPLQDSFSESLTESDRTSQSDDRVTDDDKPTNKIVLKLISYSNKS